jgi:hypothetical protein
VLFCILKLLWLVMPGNMALSRPFYTSQFTTSLLEYMIGSAGSSPYFVGLALSEFMRCTVQWRCWLNDGAGKRS